MMAEASVANLNLGLEWQRTGMESSSDDSDAYVPGVTQKGNLRPKLRPRRPRETQARIPTKQPAVEDLPSSTSLSVQDLSQSLDERRLRPSSAPAHGPASLKDLCVEDKRRIANLIKELAKVGEEREKAREELEKERNQYEQQILKLVAQQEQILQERQEVERQLMECQDVLARCQVQQPPPPLLPLPLPPGPAPAQMLSAPVDLQDTMHSLHANVGSPAGHLQRPVTDMIDREISWRRYQQGWNNGTTARHPTSSGETTTDLAQTHQGLHHDPRDGGDCFPQAPQHQQTPGEFFSNAIQSGLPPNFLSPQRQGGGERGQRGLPVTSQGSKEEIINRFFASQTPERDTEHPASPRRPQTDQADRRQRSDKTSKHRAFRPPVMSSTQKSAEIVDCLSVDSTSQQEFIPLVPDDSPGSTAREAQETGGDNCLLDGQARVASSEGIQDRPNVYTHSRPDEGWGEEGYVHNYRKLTQTERKQQLLQQRSRLLEEQKRLKQVLCEQEAMLREKQHALRRRAAHQTDGAGAGAQAGVGVLDDDPLGLIPQRKAIDAALERQRAIVDSLEAQVSPGGRIVSREDRANIVNAGEAKASNRASRKRVASPAVARNARDGSGDTFTLRSNNLGGLACRLDYSLPSDSDEAEKQSFDDSQDDDSSDERDGAERQQEPHRTDVGTSVSYHNIPRSVGNSPAIGGNERLNGHVFSATHLVPAGQMQTPGEKTMSVLEIINCLPEQSPQRLPPCREPAPFKSLLTQPQHFSPFHLELSPSAQRHHTHPISRWPAGEDEDVDSCVVSSDTADEEDDLGSDDVLEAGSISFDDTEGDNAALEESQILEDIFFLK